MTEKYNVVFTGQLRPEFSREEVVRQLIAISGMKEEQVDKFLSGGKSRIVKKDLKRQQAEKFMGQLEEIGLQMRLSPVKGATDGVSGTNFSGKTSTPQVSGLEREADNPYASPKAELEVRQDEEILDHPRKVPASHGWVWIKKALGLFFAEPWKWIGMSIIVVLLSVIVSFVPFIGFLFNAILSIIFSGGLMLAAQAQSEGEELSVGYVFRGFTHNRNQLILVGLLYLAGVILIGLVVAILVGGSLWSMFSMGPGNPQAGPEMMVQYMPMILLGFLVGLLFFVPLLMCLWFSASLVAIGNRNATTAFKESFHGCLKNVVPFLVYGLVFLVIGATVSLAFAGIVAVFSFFVGDSGSFFLIIFPMFFVLALIGIPLMSITTLSVYTGFKDIYFESSE